MIRAAFFFLKALQVHHRLLLLLLLTGYYSGTVRGAVKTNDPTGAETIRRHPAAKALLPAGAWSWVLKGKVVDGTGAPVAGASVNILGTTLGASTDNDGAFIMEITSEKDSLVITAVGYRPKTIVAGSERAITIVLEQDEGKQKLDEVMVSVAYGRQKKKEVVGSVTSINPGDLKIPSSNLTQALAGRLAGVISFMSTGEPGADNADFFVRGVSTFGYKSNPLILIDNIQSTPTDLARLQVDDIEGFSIMKDATATALYGAKGANGVILITTKEGREGHVVVSGRLENSLSQSVRNVEFADPITYMKLANEANLTRDPLSGYRYLPSKIENTKMGTDPFVYPAVDWQQALLKKSTMNQRSTVSFSGGGKVARYFVSGSMNIDNGILNVDKRSNFNSNSKLKTYSFRSNVNMNLGPKTELQTKLSGVFDDYNGPIDGASDIFRKIVMTNPVLFPAYYEPTDATRYIQHIMFGNYGMGGYNNPYADLMKGYKQSNTSVMNAQVQLLQDLDFLTDGLKFRGMVSVQRSASFFITRAYNPYYYNLTNYDYNTKTYDLTPINLEAAPGLLVPVGTEYLSGSNSSKTVSSEFYSELALNYRKEIADLHTVSGSLIGVAKSGLNGAETGNLMLSLPYRNLGLSGRATYVYDSRYAAEFNFGYNGSERFHSSKRFGFFPSAGVAYTISKEKFWEPLAGILPSLKLRATYGLVGNDAIGDASDRFFYLSDINLSSAQRGASFGYLNNYSLNGVMVNRYANTDITWEVATKTNLGLDARILNVLELNLDLYKDRRKNILMTRAAIPTTMGLEAPSRANVGEASSKGVDLALDFSKQFTPKLWMRAMGNFTYATSKYEIYEEPEYILTRDGQDIVLDYLTHRGKSLSQQWGFIAERLFVDDLDAANAPKQTFGPYGGGDIKYKDVNNDGQITNLDKVPIGKPTVPEIVYGFGFSARYQQLDFSIFFQGMARRSFWIDVNATSPFVNDQRLLLKAYSESYWSESNKDIYALWPRLSPNVNNNNAQTSTWFMFDGGLLRIKQLELGYSFKSAFMKRLGLSNARVYLNSNNLHTFSNFKIWDVEMAGNGLAYPIQRVTNIGLNFTFK
ncbi:SusC/RagA family TonB-linked outer membrane protein [Niabella hirudinis]|uniref:SusC/RagA family TonB-linked outer membrane protein n=1 Tax=Niabella hirudinis TaxID=1285929 RepID=UPI003EB94CE9